MTPTVEELARRLAEKVVRAFEAPSRSHVATAEREFQAYLLARAVLAAPSPPAALDGCRFAPCLPPGEAPSPPAAEPAIDGGSP